MKKKIIIISIIIFVFTIAVMALKHVPYLSSPGRFMAKQISGEIAKSISPELKTPPSIEQMREDNKNKLKKTFEDIGVKIQKINIDDNINELPFTVKSNARIFNSNKIAMILSPWRSGGDKFIFKEYKKEAYIPFGDFDFYSYDIATQEIKKVPEYENWKVAPGGAMGVKVVGRTGDNSITEDIGFVSIKNMRTGKEKIVDGAIPVKKASFNNQYYSSLYSSPDVSPDGRYVAFYDGSIPWKNGNQRAVGLISSDIKVSDDKIFLGWTNFVETERSSLQEAFFHWSPDSSKFFAVDDNIIFTVKPNAKEVYRPEIKEGYWNWKWSPDSKKILSFGRDPYLYVFNFDGSDKKVFLMESDADNNWWNKIGAIAWAPDSKHVIYMYSSALFFLNTITGEQGRIVSISPKQTYRNFISMSPDGRYILYKEDDEIWILETDWNEGL